MRLAAIAALALLTACGTYDVCGPSTCDGCCTASGECITGNFNQACGVGGRACFVCEGATPVCGAGLCRALPVVDSGTPDAGSDAGVDAGVDAGMLVAVALRYERAEVDASVCPVRFQRVTCDETAQVTETRLAQLQQSYADCAETVDGGVHLFVCQNCTAFTAADCNLPDGGVDHGSVPECTWPEFAVADFCAWQVP